MRRKYSTSAAGLALAGLLSAPPAAADYFADQGFARAAVRTEYQALDEGTAANPLTLGPCLYPPGSPGPTPITPCAGPTVFSQSNPFDQNGGRASSTYWLLLMNNENWTDPANPGPPDQSLPRSEPGAGIMGFTAIKGSFVGENFYRAHLVLNNTFANPLGPGGIPFMAIAAAKNRGNGGSDLGALNVATRPHVVQFTSRVWDAYPGTWNHYFWVASYWGGKPRYVFVNLYWSGLSWGSSTHSHWNWPIQESFFYPGGDLAFFDLGAIRSSCPGISDDPLAGIGSQKTFTFDINELFQCASTRGLFDQPMPAVGVLPITNMGWANEGAYGSGALWTSVHGMRMLPPEPPDQCPKCFAGPSTELRATEQPAAKLVPGYEVLDVERRLREACVANDACRESSQEQLASPPTW